MPTYPLTTLAPTIDANGISSPSFNDIYQSLIAIFQGIYGADIYMSPDSQDGQWISALANAIHDSNQACVAVFQAFIPDYAQGAGLSALVKINGLMRSAATNSTATGNVVGVAGTVITNGVVLDANGNKWNLPASVTIPLAGAIAVTVTAQNAGSILAPSGTINKISNPQLGWQSFVSTADAVAGAAVETDAALKTRQTASVSMPALGIVEAIWAAVAAVTGVGRVKVYENPTATTDANGVPAHSIAVVAENGSTTDVANAIASRKPPGIQTYGTMTINVTDRYGLIIPINFYVATKKTIYFEIDVTAMSGWVSTTQDSIKAAVLAYINSLAIGDDVYQGQAFGSASLAGTALGQTFRVTNVKLGFSAVPTGTADLVIAFNEIAESALANISVVIA